MFSLHFSALPTPGPLLVTLRMATGIGDGPNPEPIEKQPIEKGEGAGAIQVLIGLRQSRAPHLALKSESPRFF